MNRVSPPHRYKYLVLKRPIVGLATRIAAALSPNMRAGRQQITDIEVFEMRLSKFQSRLRSIACVAAVAGLLAGCGGSSNTASASGGTTPAPVTGIATPSSVSVVTATK